MKKSPALLFFALLATTAPAETPLPAPLPADRYASLRARSPFALASAAPVQPQGSFAANWFVSGIGRLGDEDFVSIKSRDLSVQFSLFGTEPHSGVRLAGVTWSEAVGKSTVILRKGTETAKLEFNEAELRQAAPTKPVAAGAGAAKPVSKAPGALEVASAGVNAAASSVTLRRRVVPIPAPR